MIKKILKILAWVVGILFLLILGIVVLFPVLTKVNEPVPDDLSIMDLPRIKLGPDTYQCGDSWLKKNSYGLWEMYIEGPAFDRGVKQGILLEEMIRKQEEAFLMQIATMIPSSNYQKFMKYFVSYFNRNLDDYIPEEYQLEIFGISKYASDEFGFIGPNFLRILNYHAAHDIGHALQNMNLVACTAFGAWDRQTSDSSMIIARNFDFYVGDDFAEDKIVAFIDPDSGHPFMMVTWAGMIGVVSGMNTKGLTITLNAAKSNIPWGAKTPVSILGREILQYASNIDEAYAIASQSETFVSEMFLIGSAIDGKAVVIEKTPVATYIFDPDGDNISVTNHFQSTALKDTELNIENIENETSAYRLERTNELLNLATPIDAGGAAAILRNYSGLDNVDIGLGNEKAINQFIAHHGIIFKPETKEVWVSTHPWQLGTFVHYDLDDIFMNDTGNLTKDSDPGRNLAADPFIATDVFNRFKEWRLACARLNAGIQAGDTLMASSKLIQTIAENNPTSYYSWWLLGQYEAFLGNEEDAIKNFNFALSKVTGSAYEREQITKDLMEAEARQHD